jgi:hypothetical protein
MRFPALVNDLRIFTIMQAYKRRKGLQTQRLARLETVDFIMFLVAGAGFEPAISWF